MQERAGQGAAVRSYLVLAATILCVVLFDWWGQSQLTEIAQQGAALSQQMSEAVRREDWAQAEPLLAQLEDCFDEHAPMLARLVEHSQIGAIETATRQLATLVSRPRCIAGSGHTGHPTAGVRRSVGRGSG